MYHELYIDVFFLINFMMDSFLLLIVRRILKCSATQINILFGSLLGSLLTCLVVIVPIPHVWIKWILLHIGVSLIMIRVGLQIKEKKKMGQAIVGLYIGGFLLGGVFTSLHQYVRIGSLFYGIAVFSYMLVQGIWSFITELQRFKSVKCKVTLSFETGKCTVDAIIDTGNCLRDALTDKPVCVVEKNVVKQYLKEDTEAFRNIPFRSIGQQEGRLPVMELSEMLIQREREYRIKKPVIGICGEHIFNGEYQMILNPDVF